MTEIRLKSNGSVITEEAYRAMHPLVSFANGEFFATANDADIVLQTEPPKVASSQVAVRNGIEQVGGKWRYKWAIEDKSPDVVADELYNKKVAATITINDAWKAQNNSYFEYQGKFFDCDDVGQQNINATNGYVALFDTFQDGWPGGWKAADNSYVTIGTVEEWKDFYKAMVAEGQKNFAYAQYLKGLVAEATSQEQLDEIRWGETKPPVE